MPEKWSWSLFNDFHWHPCLFRTVVNFITFPRRVWQTLWFSCWCWPGNESTITAVSLLLPPVALASHVSRSNCHRRNSVTALKGHSYSLHAALLQSSRQHGTCCMYFLGSAGGGGAWGFRNVNNFPLQCFVFSREMKLLGIFCKYRLKLRWIRTFIRCGCSCFCCEADSNRENA
jgi:hypothetical protein